MLNEENLIRKAQGRDEEAWTQIYEEYIDRIYSYVLVRLGNRCDAEDIAARVFLKAFQSIGSFRWTGAPFSAWLFRIAHNEVIDHVRREKPRASLDEAITVATSDDPAVLAELSLSWETVRQFLSGLTPSQRQVIELRFAGGLSTAEVARVMKKREGAIKALQHAALIALRKRLSVEANDG